MAGITATGFETKRLSDIISDRKASARTYFGNDAATGENDVLGRLLRIHADAERDLWDLIEAAYMSFNPASATGINLDRIVAYGNITRFDAEYSTTTLLITGDYLTFIPVGSGVSSSTSSYMFQTKSFVTLNTTSINFINLRVASSAEGNIYTINLPNGSYSYTAVSGDTIASIATKLANNAQGADQTVRVSPTDSSAIEIETKDVFQTFSLSVSSTLTPTTVKKTVEARSSNEYEVSINAGVLDTISDPVLGWESVTNVDNSSGGRLRETDEELRLRFKTSKEVSARGTVDALYSSLSEVSDIEAVQVYENATDDYNAEGLPPHSFTAVVLGGSTAEIAQVIWDTKPAGILPYGSTTVSVADTQGITHDISFSRPESIPIYMTIEVSAAENESLASDTSDLIRQSLQSWMAENLTVGKNVSVSRLFTPILQVAGVQVDSLVIGKTMEDQSFSNINIAFDEIAGYSAENISVIINT